MDKITKVNDQIDDQNEDTQTSQAKIRTHRDRRSVLDFRKYTKQIWLAGLGAFSRAEEEGNKLFDSLVKVGEELESKTTDIADQAVEKVSEKTKESVVETRERMEKVLDQGVNHSLNRIGLVTSKDLQHLERLILQLDMKVDRLIEENAQLKAQVRKN